MLMPMPMLLDLPRRRVRRALIVAGLAGGCLAAPSSTGSAHPDPYTPPWFPSDETVRAMLASRVEAGQAVGLVVGMIEGGQPRVVSYGKSNGPYERPLDGATVFEIGSVTKVFTCTLLADMARRGEVRLDQPVAELLPKTVHVPSRGDTLIRLVDLATQSSGLPRLPTNFAPADPANPYADYSASRLYDFLSHHTLTRAPGASYEYSNLGMGLLGHALALRSGKSYEAILTERVLKPLRMMDTRITLTEEMGSRFAAGHDLSGAIVPHWELTALAGAGALRSTANDMLTFLAANLDSNATAISADLRATHAARRPAGSPNMRIGLAWHRLSTADAEIVWHNGGTGGFRSFVGFDPVRQVGVVVLSNASGNVDDIGLHLLNPRLPLEEFTKHIDATIDPKGLDALVGRYSLAANFVMTVTREGDNLFIQATGQQKFQVYPTSDSTFYYRVVPAEVTFHRDALGKAFEIVLRQGSRDVSGKRVP